MPLVSSPTIITHSAGDYYGVIPAALTGATQASRYVGSTASGAPVAGTFAVGDMVVDRAGGVWICTAAGTPGTWGPGVAAGSVTNAHISAGAAIQQAKIAGSSPWSLLSTTTLAIDGTFDVSSIDQTHSDLVLVLAVRGADAGAADTLGLRFNNDSTAAHYSFVHIDAVTTALSSAAGSSTSAQGSSFMPGNGAPAGVFAHGRIEIVGYTSTAWNKQFTGDLASSTGTSSSLVRHALTQGMWLSTAAINRVQLFGLNTANLLAGSVLRIYGRD